MKSDSIHFQELALNVSYAASILRRISQRTRKEQNPRSRAVWMLYKLAAVQVPVLSPRSQSRGPRYHIPC